MILLTFDTPSYHSTLTLTLKLAFVLPAFYSFLPFYFLSSPSFATQRALFIKGCRSFTAPSVGHSMTQQPQYQHSPGYKTIGGLPFSGLGTIMSTWQASTHLLHPVHFSLSYFKGFAAGISSDGYVFPQFTAVPSLCILCYTFHSCLLNLHNSQEAFHQ